RPIGTDDATRDRSCRGELDIGRLERRTFLLAGREVDLDIISGQIILVDDIDPVRARLRAAELVDAVVVGARRARGCDERAIFRLEGRDRLEWVSETRLDAFEDPAPRGEIDERDARVRDSNALAAQPTSSDRYEAALGVLFDPRLGLVVGRVRARRVRLALRTGRQRPVARLDRSGRVLASVVGVFGRIGGETETVLRQEERCEHTSQDDGGQSETDDERPRTHEAISP